MALQYDVVYSVEGCIYQNPSQRLTHEMMIGENVFIVKINYDTMTHSHDANSFWFGSWIMDVGDLTN